MPERIVDIVDNPRHDLLTEVLNMGHGHIVAGCYGSKHGGDEDGNLIEADDLEQPYYDNEHSHMMADSQGSEGVNEEQDASGDPLEIMLASEAKYEAFVAAEAAREAALFDAWWRDCWHPFFKYQHRNGKLHTASHRRAETESVAPNIQPMRPRISGFREKGERHKANFLAMC